MSPVLMLAEDAFTLLWLAILMSKYFNDLISKLSADNWVSLASG